jgi:hypothetical protein
MIVSTVYRETAGLAAAGTAMVDQRCTVIPGFRVSWLNVHNSG